MCDEASHFSQCSCTQNEKQKKLRGQKNGKQPQFLERNVPVWFGPRKIVVKMLVVFHLLVVVHLDRRCPFYTSWRKLWRTGDFWKLFLKQNVSCFMVQLGILSKKRFGLELQYILKTREPSKYLKFSWFHSSRKNLTILEFESPRTISKFVAPQFPLQKWLMLVPGISGNSTKLVAINLVGDSMESQHGRLIKFL